MDVKVLNTLFYTLVVKLDVVWLHRAQQRYKLATYGEEGLTYFSDKPHPFLDAEDEAVISEACQVCMREPQEIGTVELRMVLKEKGQVEVRAGDERFAIWTVTKGIRFDKDAHPIWKKDRDAIAMGCSESLRGGSGIFGEAVEGEEVFSPTNLTKL